MQIDATADLTKQKILLVDDSRISLKALDDLLCYHGYETITLERAQEVIETAVIEQPNLILLDVMMPDVNGFDVCTQLKATSQTCDIPVIFISGLNNPLDQVRGFEVGGVDYIAKPFQAEEVLARVATHLSVQHMQRSLAEQSQRLEEANRQLEAEIAERKEIESVLRRERDYNDRLVHSIPAFLILLDTQFNIVRSNDHFATTLGYATDFPTSQYQRNYVAALVPNEQQRDVERQLQHVIASQTVSIQEHDVITANGTMLLIEWRVVPLLDEAGHVVNLLSTGIDITRQRRIEAALRSSEKKYRLLAENSSDIVILLEDSIVQYVSPGLGSVLGYTSEQLSSNNLLDNAHQIIHPDDLQSFCTIFSQEQPSIQTIVRTRHIDGHYVWLECDIKQQQDPATQVTHSILSAKDVTARQSAEEAQRESDSRYRIISEIVSNISYVYKLDNSGNVILEWSTESAVEQITNFTKDAINLRGGWGTIILDQDRSKFELHLERLRSGQSSVVEYRIVTQHNQRRWLKDMARPINPEIAHDAVVVYGGCQDITDQKQLEEKLRQAQKLEAMGQLAGGVAHHFNNMLTSIMGFVALSIEALPSDHGVVKDLQRVEGISQRAATLTRQLLTFTRHQRTQPEVTSVNELLTNLQAILLQLINATIQLKLDVAPNAGNIHIDSGQFEQLLINLVINARDAMPQGGQLVLRTERVEIAAGQEAVTNVPPGHYACITVSDTGIGMDKETQEHIFEPFFTTKEVGQGTGLGLPTCFGIVRQHDGYITVWSQKGVGTIFKVFLPQVATPHHPQSQPNTHKPALPRGSETVLLVEDEEAVRDLSERILRRQGYNVHVASNGLDAMQLASSGDLDKLDLLLTDLVMPQIEGLELATMLRFDYPAMKIILMSGHHDESPETHDATTIDYTFLSKPFTPSDLAQIIRCVLDDETFGQFQATTEQVA